MERKCLDERALGIQLHVQPHGTAHSETSSPFRCHNAHAGLEQKRSRKLRFLSCGTKQPIRFTALASMGMTA